MHIPHRAALVAAIGSVSALPAHAQSGVEQRIERVKRLLAPIVISTADKQRYLLEERMKLYGVPGVSIAVITNGAVEWARAFGVADAESKTPADTTTLFQAASISKPVAAAGALVLAELGRLDFDGDVNAQLTSWKLPPSEFTATRPVTPRAIVTHGAGLTVWGFPGYAVGVTVPTVSQILNGEKPANTPAVRSDATPGTRWLYSGGGFTILQQLMTDVGGRDFPALMQDLVLRPLGMTRSTYQQPLPPERLREAAAGHTQLGQPIPGKRHTYPEMAAAGLWTTPLDLARFLLAVREASGAGANGNGRSGLLPANAPIRRALSRMLTADTLPTLSGSVWGLGITLDGHGSTARFGHGGSNAGFMCQMLLFRDSGNGIVVMTNGARGTALMQEIIRAVATEYQWPALQPVVVSLAPVDSATAAPIVGRYISRVAGRDTTRTTVAWTSGTLAMRVGGGGGGAPVQRGTGGMFVNVATGEGFTVERDASGRVTALIVSNLWQGSGPRRWPRG